LTLHAYPGDEVVGTVRKSASAREATDPEETVDAEEAVHPGEAIPPETLQAAGGKPGAEFQRCRRQR
jgi:hypothetical protein